MKQDTKFCFIYFKKVTYRACNGRVQVNAGLANGFVGHEGIFLHHSDYEALLVQSIRILRAVLEIGANVKQVVGLLDRLGLDFLKVARKVQQDIRLDATRLTGRNHSNQRQFTRGREKKNKKERKHIPCQQAQGPRHEHRSSGP